MLTVSTDTARGNNVVAGIDKVRISIPSQGQWIMIARHDCSILSVLNCLICEVLEGIRRAREVLF